MATVNSIGSASRDYSTPAAWEAALPATLDDDYVGECYNDSEFTDTTNVVTFAGFTAGSFSVTLKCAAGESFRDNPDIQTTALAYNQSNGVGFKTTSGYASIVTVSTVDNVTIEGIQLTGGSTHTSAFTGSTHAFTVQDCIMDSSPTVGVIKTLNKGTIRNCLIVHRLASSSAGAVQFSYPTGVVFTNNTVICPPGVAVNNIGLSNTHGTVNIVNCAIFGFTTVAANVANFSGNNNASDGTVGFGSDNLESLTYADQFEDASSDWRLKSGSALIGAGVTDATNAPDDIAGTTRPSGSAYDIGCWELVVAITTGILSLGIYANPAANPAITTVAAYDADDQGHINAYGLAEFLGAQHLRETYDWVDLEPTVGNYDFSFIDRFINNTFAGLPVILNINALNGNFVALPADLAGQAWDASPVTTAYANMLSALASHVPASRLLVLIVGNEVGGYFDANPSEVSAFASFVGAAKTAAVSAFSAAMKVTASFSFASVSSYGDYSAITAVCDVPCWTYYAIDYAGGLYQVKSPHTIGDDLASMDVAAGQPGKIMLQEIGCPTAATLGGSFTDQELFLRELRFFANTYVKNGIDFTASIFLLSDFSDAVLTDLGMTGNFKTFSGSLGLLDTSGNAKPAVNMAELMFAGLANQFLSASLGLSGVSSRQTRRTLDAAVTLDSQDVKRIARVIASTLPLSGYTARRANHINVASLAFIGTASRRAMRATMATLALGGVFARSARRTITAALTFTESMRRMVRRTQQASLSFINAMRRATHRAQVSLLSFTGTAAKSMRRSLSASITFSATWTTTAIVTLHQAFDATVSFAADLRHLPRKAVSASLSFTNHQSRQIGWRRTSVLSFEDHVARRTNHAFAANLTFRSAMFRQFRRILNSVLSFTGIVTTQRLLTIAFQAMLSFTGTVRRRAAREWHASVSFTSAIRRRIGKAIDSVLDFLGGLFPQSSGKVHAKTIILAHINMRASVLDRVTITNPSKLSAVQARFTQLSNIAIEVIG